MFQDGVNTGLQKDGSAWAEADLLKPAVPLPAVGNWIADLNGNLIWISEQAYRIFGESENTSCLPLAAVQGLPQESAEGSGSLLFRLIRRALESGENEDRTVRVKREPDASCREIRFLSSLVRDGNGAVTQVVGTVSDITETGSINEEKLRAIIMNISDGICIVDRAGIVKYVSHRLGEWFGFIKGDLTGKEAWVFVHPDDLARLQSDFASLLEADGIRKTAEYRHRCKDGTYRHIQTTAVNMLGNPYINGVLMNFHDITDRKNREEEICYLNCHDALTGLFNRSYFDEATENMENEQSLPLSVIIGDINGLKLVNDAFGHAEGDKLLVQMARTLGVCCRPGDIIARTGGDEFCILLPNTGFEVVQCICRKIRKECSNYVRRNEKESFYLSISLGYETRTRLDRPIKKMMKTAEEYMYKRKLLERKSMHSSILSSIKTTMHEKNQETEEHAERLFELAKLLGQSLNLTDEQLDELELLSALHDIGKIGIGNTVLNKPSPLTREEWNEIRKHPEVGFRIAHASPELISIADTILCHHERWDGKGYPQGLKGEHIPLLSRIIAVIDSYDAMTNDRPYRKAMPIRDAVREILGNAGTQFDPVIAGTFVEKVIHFTEE